MRNRLREVPDLTNNQDSCDFIHFRNVAQGIAKWSQVLSEAYRCTRPGGHIELSESHREFGIMHDGPWLRNDLIRFFFSAYLISDDGSLKEDNPGARWSRHLNDAMIASHRTPSSEEIFRKRLENAGFVDVQTFTLPLVVGPWAKDK
jgi:SAM-dependent methyltransferase